MTTEAGQEQQVSSLDYHCEGAPAPEGFDPNAQHGVIRGAGEYMVRIVGNGKTTREDFKTEKWEGNTYILHKLYVTMVVVGGPSAGAILKDFIALPTWDAGTNNYAPIATGLANKWANFAKAFGAKFSLSNQQLWPDRVAGRSWLLSDLEGATAIAHVVPDIDKDTKQQRMYEGSPQWKVKFFGYRAVPDEATKAAEAANPPLIPPAVGSAPKPAQQDFDL